MCSEWLSATYISENTGTNFRTLGIERNANRSERVRTAGELLGRSNIIDTLLMVLQQKPRGEGE